MRILGISIGKKLQNFTVFISLLDIPTFLNNSNIFCSLKNFSVSSLYHGTNLKIDNFSIFAFSIGHDFSLGTQKAIYHHFFVILNISCKIFIISSSL